MTEMHAKTATLHGRPITIAALERFLSETEPAWIDREEWLERFRAA